MKRKTSIAIVPCRVSPSSGYKFPISATLLAGREDKTKPILGTAPSRPSSKGLAMESFPHGFCIDEASGPVLSPGETSHSGRLTMLWLLLGTVRGFDSNRATAKDK